MNRADWQQIAEERLLASESLLLTSNWPSAYYLAGYAVECGLKSCLLARLALAPELVFIERRFSEKCWTHDLEELVKLAEIEAVLKSDIRTDPTLGENWLLVRSWTERSRYEMKTRASAEALNQAIRDNVHGIMPWIRQRW